jgi:putative transcriptional regulator
MAVHCKLSVLMGIKRYNIQDIFDKTGIARSTVSNLYHDKAVRINFSTITKLCALFDCKLEDLLELTDDETDIGQ